MNYQWTLPQYQPVYHPEFNGNYLIEQFNSTLFSGVLCGLLPLVVGSPARPAHTNTPPGVLGLGPHRRAAGPGLVCYSFLFRRLPSLMSSRTFWPPLRPISS